MLKLAWMNQFNARFSTSRARDRRRPWLRSRLFALEVLESRQLLATFTVTNLQNAGAGSLRQAIIAANALPGLDTIDFDVAGTIRVARTSLPAITGTVTIDGTTAPTFAGSPVVTLDFQGSRGLYFATGAGGSVLKSLALVRAGNSGVTLGASNVTVQGNFIGLLANGSTIAGNRGDGVRINASSHGDLIGQTQPMTSINVISGNCGNGIGIYGADDNQIAANEIGTNAGGTLRRGNAQNGILVTEGAVGNIIGGPESGGNDPTANVFVVPPQGNLISANCANGVLITGGASRTTLSGNFVGTSASGNSALGNRQDGVAIVKASGNQLIGCTFTESPFVYYNVLSGNGANGLRITNSNNTTVQANFMGVGANNATTLANRGDGLLVSGSSRNTQVGGPIPLGNVISGNNKNGVAVTGRASGLVSFNTFAGTFAFGGAASNKGDGILITSSGGNNLVRTCIISGNLGNGIELGGNATGVQVTDTMVGLEVTKTGTLLEFPNALNGILIDGHAHQNAIGGFQPSIENGVTISENRGYGIAIVGSARKTFIFHTNLGTNLQGTGDLGNERGGIFVGSSMASTTIGGAASPLANIIHDSGGPGVIIRSSSGNQVLGNQITGNAGNGVTVIQARRLTVGGSARGAGNQIVGNEGYGLLASGVCTGTVVQANVIAANSQGNVNLTSSRGITFIP